MTAQLSLIPYPTLAFGSVITGSFVDQTVSFQNSGDEDLHISGVLIDNALFTIIAPPTFPVTITPDNIGAFALTIRYTPTLAATDTGVLTTLSDSISAPDLLNLTGTGVISGTAAISATPGSLNFGTLKNGATSAAQNITIKNTSDVNVTLNSVSAPTGFTISTDPTPVTLTPGQTAVIGVEFTPATEGYFTDNVSLVNTTSVSPFLINVVGLSNPITSVWTVKGQTFQTLLGLNSVGGAPILNYMNSGVGIETSAQATKQFDYWFPEADFPIRGYEKTIFRVEIYYEDLGNFELTVRLQSRRNQLSSQTQSVVGTADGRTKTILYDFDVSDEILNMTLLQLSGILSIVLILFSLQPSAEVVKNT